MDNLAHSLLGAHLSRLPAFRSVRPGLAMWTCVAASNVPDLDFVLRFAGEDRYIFEHRGLTHSLLGLFVLAPLTALVAAAIASRRRRNELGGAGEGSPPEARFGKRIAQSFLPLLLVAFVGVLGHLLLDVLTSWGTMLLLPFSDTRFSYPILFIVDPWVWLLLGLPLLSVAWRKRKGIPDRIVRRSSVTTLVVFSGYLLLCGKGFLEARATAWTHAAGRVEEIRVWAAPFGPLLWTTAVRTDEQEWHRSYVSALTGGITDAGTFRTGLDDPRVQVALESSLGQGYRWFADALYLADASPLAEDGSYHVTLGDLRFTGPFWSKVPFQLHMKVGSDFSLLEGSFVTGDLSADGQPERQPEGSDGGLLPSRAIEENTSP